MSLSVSRRLGKMQAQIKHLELLPNKKLGRPAKSEGNSNVCLINVRQTGFALHLPSPLLTP
jgi:hypothetical protein